MPENTILREAVRNEVTQQMTVIRLQVDEATRDLRQIKWTLYGNIESGEDGMVKSMKTIQSTLDKIVDEGDQRKWMQRGIAIGLGLNLLASTGALGWIEHLLKALP